MSSATPTESPVIQPMHCPSQAAVVQPPQAPLGNATNGPHKPIGQGMKAILAKRLTAEGGNPKYVSPTDSMLTPCTTKINQSKKKRFDKGKPVQLFMKKDNLPDVPDNIAQDPVEGDALSDPTKPEDDDNPF